MEDDKLVQDITDILIEKDCAINKAAVLEVAIYVLER